MFFFIHLSFFTFFVSRSHILVMGLMILFHYLFIWTIDLYVTSLFPMEWVIILRIVFQLPMPFLPFYNFSFILMVFVLVLPPIIRKNTMLWFSFLLIPSKFTFVIFVFILILNYSFCSWIIVIEFVILPYLESIFKLCNWLDNLNPLYSFTFQYVSIDLYIKLQIKFYIDI